MNPPCTARNHIGKLFLYDELPPEVSADYKNVKAEYVFNVKRNTVDGPLGKLLPTVLKTKTTWTFRAA